MDGAPRDLGTLAGYSSGTPASINKAGNVVGQSSNELGGARATYWHHVGKPPIDLNSLVPDGCRALGTVWPLTHATGINDKGMVAVYSQVETDLGPKFVAFRLTPR